MIIEFWRSIVGDAVQYFTTGSNYSLQWHYGELLEYTFVSLAVLLVICLTFKFMFSFVKLFFKQVHAT